MQKVFQKGRKHCGKRRNCSLRAISPFPTAFSKDFYSRHVKTGIVLERVMTSLLIIRVYMCLSAIETLICHIERVNTLLIIRVYMYLSAIETLICHIERVNSLLIIRVYMYLSAIETLICHIEI